MENKRQGWSEGIRALQWLVFLLANSVTLPIVIGQIYQLPPDEVVSLMQRTFLVVGAGSFLQGWLGHRLPIPDGPAGTWLGVFAILGAEVAKQSGAGGAYGTMQILETGMITAGVALLVFVATGLMGRMIALFTPLVTGSYLLLLGLQLGGVFLQGMLGLSAGNPHLDAATAVVSAGGVIQLLSALFSTVGTVPLSSAVGFVRMTGQTKLRPFLIACIMLAGVAFVPFLVRLLALLPSPVAYASVMASFVNLVGVGLQSIARHPLDQRRTSILGITLLFGSGSMILPSAVFEAMPSVFRYVFGNGLILGTIIAVVLEQLWREKPPEAS